MLVFCVVNYIHGASLSMYHLQQVEVLFQEESRHRPLFLSRDSVLFLLRDAVDNESRREIQ